VKFKSTEERSRRKNTMSQKQKSQQLQKELNERVVPELHPIGNLRANSGKQGKPREGGA